VKSALVLKEIDKLKHIGHFTRMSKLVYKLGDMVRIKAGPFAAFTGRVDGINQSKRLLKVRVDIFGRVTPVKVGFYEAERLEFERPTSPGSSQN
jgi:transcription termination/antitermination protein NusG